MSSAARQVTIGGGRPTVLIGERINPTGRKALAEALKAGDRQVVRREALAQAQAGIPREDIVIDCLALAVGADSVAGLAVIEAIRRVKAELGVNVVVGASNVSFGLPDRHTLNGAFVAAAICAGATCLIADVARVRPAALAADLIAGRDRRARRYLEAYRQRQMSARE